MTDESLKATTEESASVDPTSEPSVEDPKPAIVEAEVVPTTTETVTEERTGLAEATTEEVTVGAETTNEENATATEAVTEGVAAATKDATEENKEEETKAGVKIEEKKPRLMKRLTLRWKKNREQAAEQPKKLKDADGKAIRTTLLGHIVAFFRGNRNPAAENTTEEKPAEQSDTENHKVENAVENVEAPGETTAAIAGN